MTSNRNRSRRLASFDYTARRAYFVTCCTAGRACVFGRSVGAVIELSQRGRTAEQHWLDISNHHPHVELDAFVVMPNHVHGILLFVDDAPTASIKTSGRGSLGAVVGSYKSAVSRSINRLRPGATVGLWQVSFWDHIIRNDRSRFAIRDYIEANPRRWAQDVENPEFGGADDFLDLLRSIGVSPDGDHDAGVVATKDRRNP